jgi:hypothetical protein
MVLKGLFDEVGLAHAPPPVNGAELRFVFLQQFKEFSSFFVASNQHKDVVFSFNAAKKRNYFGLSAAKSKFFGLNSR